MTGTHRRSPKDPNLQLLSDLLTRCRKLVAQVDALRKLCAELAPEAATGTATTLQAFPAGIAACNQRVLECIAADAILARRAEIIQSVPGCGPVTVARLCGELPELGTIGRRRAAALSAIRWAPSSRACYRRPSAAGRQHKPAVVAVMRKLACPLTALLREDRCWQAEPPVRALQAVA